MILVCGGLSDIVTELVCARLEDMNEPYRFLDLSLFPQQFSVQWAWKAGQVSGEVRGSDWVLPLEEVTGVFVRYVGQDGYQARPGLPGPLNQALMAEAQAALLALLETLPVPVANRASASMSNHSKPYQAQLIRRSGLLTPHTLITNNPEEVLAFQARCGGNIIFKSLSGIRSTVRLFEERDVARLPLLRRGPAQFQAFIPGDNIRVHTVGQQVIATRVKSGAVDYRYAAQQGSKAELMPTTIPDEVAQACLNLSRQMGLLIAGIDLIETPTGEFVCLEVNPSPGFAYYEQHTGQPISAALVQELRGKPNTPQEGGEHPQAYNVPSINRARE